MRIERIIVGLGVTAQPRSYEAFRLDITMEARLDADEDATLATSTLRKQVSKQLEKAIEVEIEKLYGKAVVAKVLKDATKPDQDGMVRRAF